ncbi:MAG: transglutaminase domain-containing protein [Myxococcota bacterium]
MRAASRRMAGRVGSLLAVLTALAPLAHAQGPVLHEFVPEVTADEGDLVTSGSSGEEPAALVYDGEVLPAPRGGKLGPDEPALSADGAGAREPSFKPDRLTELEGTLGYQAVFSPSITPFKRVTALDVVRLDRDGRTPVLARARDRSRALRVEGAGVPPPDARPRERFWGEVVLDFRRGRRVPLPSVSPESRILTVRTEPTTDLRFEKNGADAFFAVAVGPPPSEPVRLVFLTDAPRGYFGDDIPRVAADTLSHEVPPVPEPVRERALTFAGELGIAPRDPLPQVLSTLTGHFRSFEESSVPPLDGGDIYLDLARSKKGVCRHRAYGFVVTAQALGIPSRFVYNEAHSWVEVKMPGVGWMRVDLGGAARGLEARGAADRPVHRPDRPDPLPRPEAYERSYSQLGGAVSGLREDAVQAWSEADGAEASSSRQDQAAASGEEAEGPAAGDEEGDSHPAPAGEGSDARASRADSAAPDEAARPTEEAAQALVPLQLQVEQGRYEAYRGREVEVAGRVTDDRGRGVAGLRVEVLLRRRGERLLGVTVSREHGWFRGRFGVPPQVPVGDYELVVRTPGDEEHAPASAH